MKDFEKIIAEREAENDELRQRVEALQKSQELAEEKQRLTEEKHRLELAEAGLLKKTGKRPEPVDPEIDPMDEIEIDFQPYTRAKRFTVESFPSDSEIVAAQATEHYLRQIPGDRRKRQIVQYRARKYGELAAQAIQNRSGKNRVGQTNLAGHEPHDAFTYKDAMKQMASLANMDKVMPIFVEIPVPERLIVSVD